MSPEPRIVLATARIIEAQDALHKLLQSLHWIGRREAERIHGLLGQAIADLAGKEDRT